MTDRVMITGLRLATHIGVTDDERAAPQDVLVDVTLEADLAAAGRSDDLSDTVDYAAAVAAIEEVTGAAERNLLEHLAEQIAARMVAISGVSRVTVRVAKASPPLEQDLDRVAIEIERQAR